MTLRFANRFVALLAAIALILTALLVPTPAHAAEAEYRVINANLGGGHDAYNGTPAQDTYDGHGSAEDPITHIVSRMNSGFGADVVTLQEVCSEDVARIQAATGYTPSPFFMMQSAQYGGQWPNSCEKRRGRAMMKGNVIFSKHPISNAQEHYLLPDPVAYPGHQHDGRRVTLGCVDVAFGPGVRTCTSHFTAGDDPADGQARATEAGVAASILNPWEKDMPVTFSGDLNSNPKTYVMDTLHRVNRDGTGANRSAWFWGADMENVLDGSSCNSSWGFCRDGAATHGANGGSPKKIDWILFGKTFSKKKNTVNNYNLDNPTSYHETMHGKQTFVW
jgi:endonuclease/exonuclease/phosphatase family metal-dependent hydrolase